MGVAWQAVQHAAGLPSAALPGVAFDAEAGSETTVNRPGHPSPVRVRVARLGVAPPVLEGTGGPGAASVVRPGGTPRDESGGHGDGAAGRAAWCGRGRVAVRRAWRRAAGGGVVLRGVGRRGLGMSSAGRDGVGAGGGGHGGVGGCRRSPDRVSAADCGRCGSAGATVARRSAIPVPALGCRVAVLPCSPVDDRLCGAVPVGPVAYSPPPPVPPSTPARAVGGWSW